MPQATGVPTQPHEGAITVPIFTIEDTEMQVKTLGQGQADSAWQMWDLNSGLSEAKDFDLSTKPSMDFCCWEIWKPNGGNKGTATSRCRSPSPMMSSPS